MDKNVLAETYAWFVTALPEPHPNQLQVQMGVHFEEVVEQLDAITGVDSTTINHIDAARLALHTLAEHLKTKEEKRIEILTEDRKEFLDSLCDQLVTATGTAYLADLKIVGGLNEVNRSNYSKFDEHGNPIFLDSGKIAKSERYTKPDLEPFL